MSFCVCNTYTKQIAWCREYSSAIMMAQTFGGRTIIIETEIGIHRDIVAFIRKSWQEEKGGRR